MYLFGLLSGLKRECNLFIWTAIAILLLVYFVYMVSYVRYIYDFRVVKNNSISKISTQRSFTYKQIMYALC